MKSARAEILVLCVPFAASNYLGFRASALLSMYERGCERKGEIGARPGVAYYASHIQDSTQLRVDGADRPNNHSTMISAGVCAQYTGSRNGLAHALQDSIVGSDSGTPKLPRSTVPV